MPTPRMTKDVGSVGAVKAVCPAGKTSFASATEQVSFPAAGRERPVGGAGKAGAGAAKVEAATSANEMKVENIT